MKKKDNGHTKVHRVAKGIVCAIVIVLLLLNDRTFDILAVLVWFWGVNPLAYFLEGLLKIRHRHKII